MGVIAAIDPTGDGLTRPVTLGELGQRYRQYRLADADAARLRCLDSRRSVGGGPGSSLAGRPPLDASLQWRAWAGFAHQLRCRNDVSGQASRICGRKQERTGLEAARRWGSCCTEMGGCGGALAAFRTADVHFSMSGPPVRIAGLISTL